MALERDFRSKLEKSDKESVEATFNILVKPLLNQFTCAIEVGTYKI
jgi:hypothetical protein